MKIVLGLATLAVVLACCNSAAVVDVDKQRYLSTSPLDTVDSDWGYVTVRDDAHMFWWLFMHDTSYAPSFLAPQAEVPVIVWLQGGPGASGVGYGNFEELGPLDINLERRNTSWTGVGHVLFVDNPVGSGYSYVSSSDAYTKNIDEIASDMVALLKGFYNVHQELKTNPFYIFCESYGGKMAAATALALQQEKDAGTMDINLKGVGLGDGWNSPMDSVNTWAEYLYQMSLLDENGKKAVENAAAQTQQACDDEQWERCTNLWSYTESVIIRNTDNVDFYNILAPHHATVSSRIRQDRHKWTGLRDELVTGYALHVAQYATDPLDELMNGQVKDYLGIPRAVRWGSQSGNVFNAQAGDFMKDNVDTVNQLIEAGLKVAVYNGQLDLIVDTPGQELWMKKLKSNNALDLQSQKWTPEYAYLGQDTGGYSKTSNNLSFWWVLKAGHMVPADQGEFMLYLMDTVMNS